MCSAQSRIDCIAPGFPTLVEEPPDEWFALACVGAIIGAVFHVKAELV